MSCLETTINRTFDFLITRKTKYHNVEIATELHNKIYAPIATLLFPYFGKYNNTEEFKNVLNKVKIILEENIGSCGIHLLHKFNRIENLPQPRKKKKQKNSKKNLHALYFDYFCHYVLKEYNQLRKTIGLTRIPYNTIIQLDPVAKDDFKVFVINPLVSVLVLFGLYFILAITIQIFSIVMV